MEHDRFTISRRENANRVFVKNRLSNIFICFTFKNISLYFALSEANLTAFMNRKKESMLPSSESNRPKKR